MRIVSLLKRVGYRLVVNIQSSYVYVLMYVYGKTLMNNVGAMSLAIPLGWIQGVLFLGTG